MRGLKPLVYAQALACAGININIINAVVKTIVNALINNKHMNFSQSMN
jgi:hypothetical protein